MTKTRPPYTAEFREEAVRLALTSGRRTSEIAAELGVGYESLRKWIKQRKLDGWIAPGVTSSEREVLRRLHREVRVLRGEREILRRAAAYIARQSR